MMKTANATIEIAKGIVDTSAARVARGEDGRGSGVRHAETRSGRLGIGVFDATHVTPMNSIRWLCSKWVRAARAESVPTGPPASDVCPSWERADWLTRMSKA